MSSNISTNSEIERLNGEVTRRRKNSEFWDTWNIRLLWVAGFIAVSLAITSVGASRSNRKLLESSDELEKTKDRALQADLKSRDEKIAGTNQLAGEANERAGKANEHAQKLENDNFSLRGQVAHLEAEAANALTRQAEAEKQLELVKKKQEPRGVPIAKLRAELSTAPPGKLVMEYIQGSPETYLFATALRKAIVSAGWQVSPLAPSTRKFEESGASQGDFCILARNLEDPSNPKTTQGALWAALTACGFHGGGVRVPDLSDDVVVLVIQPK